MSAPAFNFAPVIVGPCPCQGCGRPVSWNGAAWLPIHDCSQPMCMTDDEWRLWQAANRTLYPHSRSGSPCHDCLPDFAEDQECRQPRMLVARKIHLESRRRSWREAQRRRRARVVA